MSEERPLKTDFYDKQAREISKRGVPLPLMVLGAVVLAGILFGGYQLTMYILNFDKIQAIKNVAVTLAKPELFDGVAKVDVSIQNLNPQSISAIAFRYNIIGPTGDTAASGIAHIPEMVPIGATRRFQHVTLGPLTASAARMQTELIDVKLGPKSALTADQFNQFVETAAMKDDDRLKGFTDFVKAAPNFSPGYVGLCKAYLAGGEDKNAENAFRQAVKLDAKNADAHYCLGLALLNLRQRDEAAKEIGIAYDLAPNDPDILKTIQDNRN
jgi:tetratricopeptide (TPR) repeat protein